jgi:SOS-response transcriptional repressor LexA
VQPIEDALAQTGLNLQDGDFFTHRVEGDSMRDAAIRDGDVLLVRRQVNAREGDIVVATIPDEVTGEPLATVKRLRAMELSAFCRRTLPTSRSRTTRSPSSAR